MTAFAVQLGVVEVLKLLEIELTPLSDDPLYHLITLYHDTKIDLEETITRAYQILTTGTVTNFCSNCPSIFSL